MNNKDGESEIKKFKEGKEASESYEDEDEAIENSLEGSGTDEECPPAEIFLPAFPPSVKSRVSLAEVEPSADKEKSRDSLEEKKRSIIKERWLSVTGRKPRNIPNLRRIFDETAEREKIVFFGDRRPALVEKERRLKWMNLIADQAYKRSAVNYGAIYREIRLPHVLEGLWCIRFHPELEYLTTACRNGGVQVRDPNSGEIIWTLKTLEFLEKLPVRTLRYYPHDGNKLYVAGAQGVIQVFDLETGTNVGHSDHNFQIGNMDFTADGLNLPIAGRNGLVAVVDAATLKVICQKFRPNIEIGTDSKIEEEFHRFRIYGLKCHPTEVNLFATGGWDRNVKIWDIRVPGAVLSFNGPFICGDALDINENTILTASWYCEESVQLWDFSSGKLIQTVPIHTKATKNDGEFLYRAQFFNDKLGLGRSNPRLIVLGGSGFNEVDVVRIADGKVLASFPSYKAVTCLDTCAGCIAYGGLESLLRIGQVHLPKKY